MISAQGTNRQDGPLLSGEKKMQAISSTGRMKRDQAFNSSPNKNAPRKSDGLLVFRKTQH